MGDIKWIAQSHSNAENGYKPYMTVMRIVMAVSGVAFVWAGSSMGKSQRYYYYSNDIEGFIAKYMPALMIGAGIGLVVVAILFGVLIRGAARRHWDGTVVTVYKDHIEGYAVMCEGNNMTNKVDFYETFDRVSSASEGDDMIIITLKSGGSIRCRADNAGEVVKAIRERL